MKNVKFNYPIYFLLLTGLFFAACKKNNDFNPGNGNRLPETTKVINEIVWNNQLVSLDTSDYTFVFKTGLNLSAGDIFVTEAGGGYLRKVTSVEQDNDGNYVVKTSHVSLSEAVINMSEKTNFNLQIDYERKNEFFLADGLKITDNQDYNSLNLVINYFFYDGDNDTTSTGDQIKFSGTFNFTPEVSNEIKILNASLQKLSFDSHFLSEQEMSLSGTVNAADMNREDLIAGIYLKPIVVNGVVPVVLQPQLDIYAGLDLNSDSHFQYFINQNYESRSQIGYTANIWTGNGVVNKTNNPAIPLLNGEVHSVCYLKPELKFIVYNTDTISLFDQLNGDLFAESRSVDWDFYEGISETGFIQSAIWDKEIPDFTKNLIREYDLVKNGNLPSDTLEFVTVEGGTFTMGCTFEQGGDCNEVELPAHTVTLDGFLITKFEITNQQYCDFLNAINCPPSGIVDGVKYVAYDGDVWAHINYVAGKFVPLEGEKNMPVMAVSWYGADAFAKWVGGRLPTEAEWEFAARGGIYAENTKYSGSNNWNDVAWVYENTSTDAGFPRHVGLKTPNELGLYDMSGNVWEWCNDWYDGDYYSISPQHNPQGFIPDENDIKVKVVRGGSTFNTATDARVSKRNNYYPDDIYDWIGFRIVKDL